MAGQSGSENVGKALVLGGGGVIGVAWETGVIEGLADRGVDLRRADLIIGTSAGSMVGTRIAAGHDVSKPVPSQSQSQSAKPPMRPGGPDLAKLGPIFKTWAGTEVMDERTCREIGALAGSAETTDEASWIAETGGSVGETQWPATDLRLVAVDIETGERVVHDRDSGAPLAHAIASSCAVPGMFPPVTIGGRRYMDGGVWSGTSADLALETSPEHVLVIAPICARTAPIGVVAERSLDAEVVQLRAGGAEVCVVLPSDAEIAAFGPNLMDGANAEAARQAGRVRGQVLAEGEAAGWR